MTNRISTDTDLVGYYGPNYTEGILSEHVDLLSANTATDWNGHTVTLGLDPWMPQTPVTFNILCSELVEIPTEDGSVVGRCGSVIVDGSPWCSKHFEPAGPECPRCGFLADNHPFGVFCE